jgi:hypothetical protein
MKWEADQDLVAPIECAEFSLATEMATAGDWPEISDFRQEHHRAESIQHRDTP